MKRDKIPLHKKQEESVAELHRPGLLVADSQTKLLNVVTNHVAKNLSGRLI